MLRPVAEYAAFVYHSSLTDDQDEWLERLQNHVLKCIYGPFNFARKLRRAAGIPTLRCRRINLCDKLVKKALANPRFQHWFPLRTGRMSSRNSKQELYHEEKARCDRLFFNSPLFFFRRRLNGKERKTYGKRNGIYRED